MASSPFPVDAVALEGRLTTIELRILGLERTDAELKRVGALVERLDERSKFIPGDKELSSLLQRLSKIEEAVSHHPTRLQVWGIFGLVLTAAGIIVGLLANIERLRASVGF